MKNYYTMLHMKLNSVVCLTALLAFLPSSAFAGICFLPDCMDEDVVQGDINMNINSDTEYCEKEGYTYYSSGECPQYYAKIGTCSRDDHYLKCDAATWCKNNGYNTQTCSLPSFVNNQCPNGYPLYQGCKEDRPRACREQGYVNSCSPGRLYATSGRCPWDNSYGTCCSAAPSAGCPSNYGVDCDASRGSSGTDKCGYTCYRCCSDVCPSGSKNYSGSYASTTECGSTCYYCKDCTSGETYYSGSYAGSSECGTCYYCDDTCRSGDKSVSCSSTENKVRVSSTECGSSCYECQYNSDCDAEDKTCTYGCASTNSCGKCTRCGTNPDCDVTDMSCPEFGCASINSCGKCTSCKGDPACDVTSLSCPYGCASENSCGKCTKCKGDPACDVTSLSCPYGCASENSCGKCTKCKEETCNYTITASDCSSQCKNVGSQSCTKNGTTYYASCGSSKCGNGQTCNNGTCHNPVPTNGWCCGYSMCDSTHQRQVCINFVGMDCYEYCKYLGYPDCTDMQASCRASGGTPVFKLCGNFLGNYDVEYFGQWANFNDKTNYNNTDNPLRISNCFGDSGFTCE